MREEKEGDDKGASGTIVTQEAKRLETKSERELTQANIRTWHRADWRQT